MAELDGNYIHGRPDLNAGLTRRSRTCADCGVTAMPGPSHDPACWRYYITTRIWDSPAAAAARDWLAGADAMWAESGDAARRPLSDLLRGVLAVIGETAGAS